MFCRFRPTWLSPPLPPNLIPTWSLPYQWLLAATTKWNCHIWRMDTFKYRCCWQRRGKVQMLFCATLSPPPNNVLATWSLREMKLSPKLFSYFRFWLHDKKLGKAQCTILRSRWTSAGWSHVIGKCCNVHGEVAFGDKNLETSSVLMTFAKGSESTPFKNID